MIPTSSITTQTEHWIALGGFIVVSLGFLGFVLRELWTEKGDRSWGEFAKMRSFVFKPFALRCLIPGGLTAAVLISQRHHPLQSLSLGVVCTLGCFLILLALLQREAILFDVVDPVQELYPDRKEPMSPVLEWVRRAGVGLFGFVVLTLGGILIFHIPLVRAPVDFIRHFLRSA